MVTGVGSINQALFGPECSRAVVLAYDATVLADTQGSNIGMGGPVMVEGCGLGGFKPEQIGPSAVQSGNGVIDILVADEGACLGPAGR